MGVDYDANFGLGYEVRLPYSWNGDEDYEVEDFLDELLKDTPFDFTHWGDEGYSGDPYTYAIVLSEVPNRSELADKLWELEKFLTVNNVEYNDSTYLVGGLHTH